MRQLGSYLSNSWPLIILAAISAIIAGLTSTTTPIFAGAALTSIEYIWKGQSDVVSLFGGFLNLGLYQSLTLALVSAAISSSLNYLQGYLLIGITQKMTYRMRVDLADKINTLPLSYFDKYKFGDILSRMTNDVDTISQTLTQSISEIFRSFALVTSILVIMFVLRWDLAIIASVSVFVSLYVAGRFVKLSQKFFRQAAKNNGDMNGHVEEVFNGHNVVKVFNYQERAKKEFDEINDRIFETSWKSQFISGIMIPVQFFFTNLAYIAIAMYGGYLVATGALLSGFILTYIQYTRQVAQPIQSIGQSASVLQQTAASAERIFQLLNAESEPDETKKQKQLKEVKGHVKFENVQFSYVPGTEVIKGFSADIKPGQMVAIVGPTGAGKTTMVNLLMRFYETTGGKITIDGVDIKDMSRDEVRSYFGMVLQDTWIFEGTIEENIRYGSIDKSPEEVIEAAIAAQTDHFIKSLPDGYKFMLNEDGLNISQGQRQLITISRAMLANKPMLILDEATSSVDTRTEILIQTAMDRLMKGRTAFVIAHRLSTIKNADVIFVMKDGNIIEQGNHNELLQQNGFYAELYNSQFNN
ncbi:ABC-type multidrug/protein/lipid transport system ATPase component [Acholeplasma hippikon]|uniref:ABC-type multidrug/protein/lipid transport system ATPase component n=2 Tax=Acholeplasma hippikon TaxID=264636 RepID=A0A449BI96_9MOLU|nr:ABC-type multidrug/protein/lipid transport system ATPase component [Acholeplasma hippikon]